MKPGGPIRCGAVRGAERYTQLYKPLIIKTFLLIKTSYL